MWLFIKFGHLSLGQDPFDPDFLFVHAQMREEIAPFVALLDEVAGQKHEIEERTEGDYHFVVRAERAVVAEAVARTVADIDYDKLVHSFHVDFGKHPGYLLWLNKTGLQVATVRE
jgi:hypothetical protein